jgi:uncharacterized protein YdiU (UPF0061 family)
LADFVIDRVYPELAEVTEEPYLELFSSILDRQVRLIATWMAHGFIHGVMNTDNMAVSGETIDFGPCAFMDRFNPGQVYSSIDEYGRYAWNRQADIGLWNLTRLAEAMLPLLAEDQEAAVKKAEQVLAAYPDRFNDQFNLVLGNKTGIEQPDRQLLKDMLSMLQQTKADYTLFFRNLAQVVRGADRSCLVQLTDQPEPLIQWLENWQPFLPAEAGARNRLALQMDRVNPLYIPRTWKLEQALDAANEGNLQPFETLLAAVQNPFLEDEAFTGLDQPPPAGQPELATYCET